MRFLRRKEKKAAPAPPAPDTSFVFNIVWVGEVFDYLQYFVASQIAQSDARFRFLSNGCGDQQLEKMEAFAERHPGRVVEVIETSKEMGAHGVALDTAFDARDDGEFFCTIDPDILATGPFVRDFAARLDTCAGVTSGRGVWVDDDVVPEGHKGVAGEMFYSRDGYLFGSPHFGMYRRAEVQATMDRWGIGFKSAGPELSDEAKAKIQAAGHDYILYDTGKILNILLQEDGNQLCHFEHPNVMHIGGLSDYILTEDAMVRKWDPSRFEVARFTASILRDLCHGKEAEPMPDGLEPAMAERLGKVRGALIDMIEAYGP